MSYQLYINGNLIELSVTNPIAQTKQVNDLARLDNRQSNMTNKFTAPLTANNVRAMENVYLVGNQSNVPYQKNEANLFDAESGKCLIYKGWANVTQTSKKGYEIYIYDGIIDFYRRIENKTLTDVGIAGLNHAKSITNIIASWSNTLPYFYAIADYNGKNKFVTTGGTHIDINTDYQVPSARVSYIWDQIHQFAGFTYSGSYFATQDFLNLFMTFPKPVPTLVPHRILVHAGSCYPRSSVAWNINEVGPGVGGWHTYYLQTIPRENFTTPYASVTNNNSTTPITGGGAVYNHNYINILTAGTYSIDIPLWVGANYFRRDSTNTVVESGTVVADPTGTFKTYLFVCNAGDMIYFILTDPELTLAGLTFDWELNRIDGFEANFELALVDFKATEFVKEIIQRGGLTSFKDKYSNHIEYLTMDEILRTTSIEDWSNKFQYKDIEKYQIGNYAKQNNFKYRYNTDNEIHNNGYITINDENLQDSIDILESKIYSPERDTNEIIGRQSRVFKIWEKELQDDSTIKYKDLTGRYYFLRFEMVPVATTLASEKLNTEQAVTEIAFATFVNLNFNEIIANNYSAISTILNKAKINDGYFYLKPSDVEAFTFKKLIYVEQLASYFLVNKIVNFVKGKVTKCEIIEVDYERTAPIVIPPPSFITINSASMDSCQITFDVATNLIEPVNVIVHATTTGFIVPPATQTTYDIPGVIIGGRVTFPISELPGQLSNYDFTVQWASVISNVFNGIVVDGSCYTPTFINVTSSTELVGGSKQITFTTNIPFPFQVQLSGNRLYPAFAFFFPIEVTATGTTITVTGIPPGPWAYHLQSGFTTSNEFY